MMRAEVGSPGSMASIGGRASAGAAWDCPTATMFDGDPTAARPNRGGAGRSRATGDAVPSPADTARPAESSEAAAGGSYRFGWLLGREARLRLRLKRMLTATGVYLLSLLFQLVSTRMGLADPAAAGMLTLFLGAGLLAFYALIRSGLSLRFSDPALTLPQMTFAIVAVALGYLTNGMSRGVVPMLAALVLLFGAFTLPAATCRVLGWLAVATFALAMGGAALLAPARFEPVVELFHFVIVATVLPTVAYLAGQLSQLRIDQQREKKALRTATERLTLIATHDELTRLPNRRHVEDWLTDGPQRPASGPRTCIALIDLDHFKKVNDRYGHGVGDEVLKVFAAGARKTIRQGDVLARWGGEEFLLVMPDATTQQARIVLDRYRRYLVDPATWPDRLVARVTFSAGIASFAAAHDFDDALRRADSALYDAKRLGRDRVCAADARDASADEPVAHSCPEHA